MCPRRNRHKPNRHAGKLQWTAQLGRTTGVIKNKATRLGACSASWVCQASSQKPQLESSAPAKGNSAWPKAKPPPASDVTVRSVRAPRRPPRAPQSPHPAGPEHSNPHTVVPYNQHQRGREPPPARLAKTGLCRVMWPREGAVSVLRPSSPSRLLRFRRLKTGVRLPAFIHSFVRSFVLGS